jgi:LCP family protein required for cell wall assembly
MARTSPVTAAALSFVVPGLGQAALGARRRAVLLFAPVVALLVAAALLFAQGLDTVVDLLLRPEVLLGLLVLDLVALVYHLAAVVDAFDLGLRVPGRRRAPTPLSTALLVALLVATVDVHGWMALVGYDAYQAAGSAFPDKTGSTVIPSPSFEPESPMPTTGASPSAPPTQTAAASPAPTPTPVPEWAADDRLNLLLIGSDAGPGRWSLRTDTMIVLSVDVATKRAAMFGIPRNLIGVPLAPESAAAFSNGRFPDLLNALYVYAMDHPNTFPGGDQRGFRAVAGAIQQLVGVPLDGMAVVNLQGFVALVDAIGGLWIDVPDRVVDAAYPLENGKGSIAIDIAPGCQKLNGRMALAYARSRHQDSDYFRMDRQQQTLLALRRQVDPIALIPQVPRLLEIARDDFWTTIPRSEVGSLIRLAEGVNASRVKTVLFVPPRYPEVLTTAEIGRIRSVVRNVFTGSSSGGGAGGASAAPTAGTCP